MNLKKLLIALFVSNFCFLNAQSFRLGTIEADAGIGFGVYGIRTYFPNESTTAKYGVGVAGTIPSVNAEIGLFRYLGVGVRYRNGTYRTAVSGPLRGTDIMLIASFHFANKNKNFDFPIGVGYGLSNLTQKPGSVTGEHLFTNGGIFNVHVSPHFYFGKYIGMFVTLGYNQHLFNKLQYIDHNGVTYTEADGFNIQMGGVYFEFGIAGRLNIFKKKEEKKAE